MKFQFVLSLGLKVQFTFLFLTNFEIFNFKCKFQSFFCSQKFCVGLNRSSFLFYKLFFSANGDATAATDAEPAAKFPAIRVFSGWDAYFGFFSRQWTEFGD